MIIDFTYNPELFIKKYHKIYKDTMNYDTRAKDIILKKARSFYGLKRKHFFGLGRPWSDSEYVNEYCYHIIGEFTYEIDAHHVRRFRILFRDLCKVFDINILKNGDLEYSSNELLNKRLGFSIDSSELIHIEKSQYFIDTYLKEEIK